MCTARRKGVSRERLSRQQRIVWAAQLTAVTALLADFELWPGLWALRQSWIEEGEDGWRARLPAAPTSLAASSRRLGGGERAALVLRDAVIAAVSQLTGVEVTPRSRSAETPGFFLDPFLDALIAKLNGEGRAALANSLWACRLSVPPLPATGEVAYWSVADDRWARRLALASVVAAREAGTLAVLQTVGERSVETAPQASVGVRGMLVLVGRPSPEELSVVDRWVDQGSRSAVICGSFPRGWDPPRPAGFEGERLHRHIAVTGIPRADGRAIVERRAGRFDPFSRIDQQAMTTAIREAMPAARKARAASSDAAPENRLRGLLELLPEGLPEGFVAVHSGLGARDLRQQADEVAAVLDHGRWRLAEPPQLRRHPLHREIAAMFAADDPRRLRHLCLAGDDAAGLDQWLRRQLDELQAGSVRALLADVAAGELGTVAQCAMVEACMSVLDLAGARRVVQEMPAASRQPWERWLAVVDSANGDTLSDSDLAHSPPGALRATVELGLIRLRRAMRRGGDPTAAARVVSEGIGRMKGRLRRAMEIRRLLVVEPRSLDDPALRRALHGGDATVRRLLWRHWARVLDDRGRARSARRLLAALERSETSPGLLGLIRFDLAGVEADLGRFRASDRLNLGAFRLLQLAGFTHRTRDVLFNLAVSDIDRLQVGRARRRLELLTDERDDPMTRAEQARLTLAMGELELFESQVAALEAQVRDDDRRLAPGVSFLQGARALFRGDREDAAEHFARGGMEGATWSCLHDALLGRAPSPEQPLDGWGIVTAAAAAARIVAGEAIDRVLPPADEITVEDALGMAMLAKLLGIESLFGVTRRRAAARCLASAGLDGWARLLRGAWTTDGSLIEVLAELSECGSLELLSSPSLNRLLDHLGLSGFELRGAGDGVVVCRFGAGPQGSAASWGSLIMVPLGGEVHETATWRLFRNLVQQMVAVSPPRSGDDAERTGLHGCSEAMQAVRDEIRRYAPSDAAVVVLGETGVGKELAARALHRMSGRTGPFVAVNAAGIPDALLESELFGSVKGAFTGADRNRPGLVDAADGGTLFLDEIGDLGLHLQVKLLRFLESQEVRPVGSTSSHTVQVRVVSATHRDLQERIANGSFRSDLFYRIAAVVIRLPPLRERRADIPMLRAIFAERSARRAGRPLVAWSRDAEDCLARHSWPGNVRELQNVVEAALLRADGQMVRVDHLGLQPAAPAGPRGSWEEAIAGFRRQLLESTLERHGGNRSAAARELGISRQALLYHIARLGLPGAKK